MVTIKVQRLLSKFNGLTSIMHKDGRLNAYYFSTAIRSLITDTNFMYQIKASKEFIPDLDLFHKSPLGNIYKRRLEFYQGSIKVYTVNQQQFEELINYYELELQTKEKIEV